MRNRELNDIYYPMLDLELVRGVSLFNSSFDLPSHLKQALVQSGVKEVK